GQLTTLHTFRGVSDGDSPGAGLVQGTNGKLYGTTIGYKSGGYGTVYEVTTNGSFTTLLSFNETNGANPEAGLVFANDGKLYGLTTKGGPGGGGVIFRLSLPVATIRLGSAVRLASGGILLTCTGPANASYRLWGSADLSAPVSSWSQLS